MSQATQLLPFNWTGPRARNVALWVLQIGAAATFFGAGLGKLTGDPHMVALFEALGAGSWFRYLTGAIELTGALLLLIPVLSGVGALLLAGVMLGAIATHLFWVGGSPALPAALLLVVGVVAYGRRERTLRLLGR